MTTADVCQHTFGFRTRVVPVIVITDVKQAVPLAHALLDGGIDAMEITLRHAAGLAGIEAVARSVPEMKIGAGTVTRPSDMKQVKEVGAQFALSPGLTPELHQAAMEQHMPFIPGIMTPSEAMRARDWGYDTVKLFPASQAGGVSMVKALVGPLPDIKLCPTGGVNMDNLTDYLSLPNVAMVGGTWLTPLELIGSGDWSAITQLAHQAVIRAKSWSS